MKNTVIHSEGCTCGRIKIGLGLAEGVRNWNPDCPVHQWDDRLQAQADSAVEWQLKAREAQQKQRYQMKTPPYWSNDEHALMAGMLMGHLMSKGVVCSYSTDAEGNYMNELIIEMDPGLDSMRVKVEVLPY